MINCYDKIIEFSNIKEAYLDIVNQFEENNKNISYSGLDGKNLNSYDLFSEKLLLEIQNELKKFKSIEPPIEVKIPKRNKPGQRDIYIYIIKERIKAQAVYRIIEPYFESFFSEYLYSYRSSHPHHRALKSIVKRYKKNSNEYVIIGDISNYSNVIDRKKLLNKIKKLVFDKQTEKLINLYIEAKHISGGNIKKSEGIITGLPVMILFNNLYLDEFDKIIGNQIDLYRRVGDDFILFDHKEKLENIKTEIHNILINLNIDESSQKISLQKISEDFNFLGYRFSKGVISILPQSVKNIQIHIRGKLRFNPHTSVYQKKKKLLKILFEKNSIKNYFIQLVRQYNYTNDTAQISFISEYFFKRLTIYFYGSYSPRNQRKTIQITKGIKIPSFMRYYALYHTGQFKKLNLLS
jgi:retron-type reverse transcriptase